MRGGDVANCGICAHRTKKMIVSGAIWLGVCVGNIAGPFFFVDDQAPTYGIGIGAILVCVRPFSSPSSLPFLLSPFPLPSPPSSVPSLAVPSLASCANTAICAKY